MGNICKMWGNETFQSGCLCTLVAAHFISHWGQVIIYRYEYYYSIEVL